MLCSKEEKPSTQSFSMEIKKKKNDGRKKDLIYKIPCRDCSLCYIGETAQWYDEREKQHKDAFETMTKIMHSSDISEQLDMKLQGYSRVYCI